jgi:hypothetical protein
MVKSIKHVALFIIMLSLSSASFADSWPSCPSVTALSKTLIEDANSHFSNDNWIAYGHTWFQEQQWLVGVAFINAEDESIARTKFLPALTGAISPPLQIKSFSFTEQGCADPANCVIYYCLYHTNFNPHVVISASINAGYTDTMALLTSYK